MRRSLFVLLVLTVALGVVLPADCFAAAKKKKPQQMTEEKVWVMTGTLLKTADTFYFNPDPPRLKTHPTIWPLDFAGGYLTGIMKVMKAKAAKGEIPSAKLADYENKRMRIRFKTKAAKRPNNALKFSPSVPSEWIDVEFKK